MAKRNNIEEQVSLTIGQMKGNPIGSSLGDMLRAPVQESNGQSNQESKQPSNQETKVEETPLKGVQTKIPIPLYQRVMNMKVANAAAKQGPRTIDQIVTAALDDYLTNTGY